MVAIWFLGVDVSLFVENCPDCGFGSDNIQYRFLTIPISQRTNNSDTLLSKVATDIGAECKHPKLSRYHQARYWGLLICACPCDNGMRMSGGFEWYDDKAKTIVQEMARANPSLRDQITKRVVKHHDWEYWKAFIERVKALRGIKPDAKE